MMKKQVGLLSGLLLCLSQAMALTIETIDLNQTSTPVGGQYNRMGPITADSQSYLGVVNIANEYLWFALAAVCVATLIYVGFKLMTAQGDKAKMQQANRALVGMVVGLAIAYFSYTMIRMVVNWF